MTIIDNTPVDVGTVADSVEQVRAALKEQPSFRSDAQVVVSTSQNGGAADVSVDTKHGFKVAFRSSADALAEDPAGVAAQLQALAYEELARRYDALKKQITDLAAGVA